MSSCAGKYPDVIRKSMELWIGCVAGALNDHQYVSKLVKAGFADIEIETTREYTIEDARTFLAAEGLDATALSAQVEGTFISAFVRASKRAKAAAPGHVIKAHVDRLAVNPAAAPNPG